MKSVNDYSTPGGNPWGTAFNSAGRVWVALPGCDPTPKCSASTPPGKLALFDPGTHTWTNTVSLPAGYGQPLFVAVDPSGKVWFTMPVTNAIGALLPPPPPGAGGPFALSQPGALEALVEPPAFAGAGLTRGDPEAPLRWTCKSVRRLAQARQAQGHEVSRTLVAHLLNEAGYSLQGNRKTTEGDSHPDRDAQFGYINTQVTTALAEQQPVISVDTKKKELVGDFRNTGREYRPQGNPEEVRVHDFLIKELGRAVPYGIYDLAANSGWVSVGVDHDTAAFAVNSASASGGAPSVGDAIPRQPDC